MPIKIPNELPATKVLKEENIFVMRETRAVTQDVRPLQIVILNLMPTKITTETQLARLIGNTPLQVEVELMQIKGHNPKNTPEEHMLAFYKNFDDLKHRRFDGMIITGAPLEHLAFEEVAYWQELTEIMAWSKTHVFSTFHICWAAQAGLYYHFGIKKHKLAKKLFGIFPHTADYKNSMLFRGFDDVYMVPHSRHTTIRRKDVEKIPELRILSSSEEAGVHTISTARGRQFFVTGHSEYDANTLAGEYFRDKQAGLEIDIPQNYFPNDDPSKEPLVTWRSHANLLYSNWLNYFVYQNTPYNLDDIC